MPPKFKFTREQIITAALDVTRKNGIAGLTARGLAAELGSSSKPIFGLFQNMEEVQNEVLSAAYMLYHSYIQKGMTDGKYPPYKASGIAYIQFAKEEKELFKLLFMRDRTGEKIEENREEMRPMQKDVYKRQVAIHPYMWYNKDILRIKSVTWKWSRNIVPFIIKGFAAPSAKICPCVGGNSQQ